MWKLVLEINAVRVERSVNYVYFILHGGIALNNLRGKWEMVQSS